MEHNNILDKLSKSKFRSSFHLRKYMIDYINDKGLDTIERHTSDFIRDRLSDAYPKNDGKQTPTKGHPTFIAMHACACCCRGCLYKWHHIEMGKPLSNEEQAYIKEILMTWIKKEYKKN